MSNVLKLHTMEIGAKNVNEVSFSKYGDYLRIEMTGSSSYYAYDEVAISLRPEQVERLRRWLREDFAPVQTLE